MKIWLLQIVVHCSNLMKMFMFPPPNGDYLVVFLRSLLAHRKGHKVNWSLYVHDCIVQQMKKTPWPPLASINNYSLPSSKSITLLAYSNYNQNNGVTEEDSLVFLGERIYVELFSSQTKLQLWKGCYKKLEFTKTTSHLEWQC